MSVTQRGDTPSQSPLSRPEKRCDAISCRQEALTSLRSCRHSRTARLLLQVCLGHSRVRSSRQASSSDSFQPVALRGGEAPAGAAGAGASLAAASSPLWTEALGGSAGPMAAFSPRTEPKEKEQTNSKMSSGRNS